MKPKSPMRLEMNALFAAAAAASRVNQWPMSRYELTPTSSQKMNIIAKLFASTMPSIENMKSDRLPKNRAFALIFLHIDERIDMHERADAGDDQQHDLAQLIDGSPMGNRAGRNRARFGAGRAEEDEEAGEAKRRTRRSRRSCRRLRVKAESASR